MSAGWTGGFGNVGGPGTPKPKPSPGHVAHLHIALIDDDGYVTNLPDIAWEGYTAADYIRERTRRWKEAGRKYERDGNVLSIRHPDGLYVERITVTEVTT